jgi:hypothetical protein
VVIPEDGEKAAKKCKLLSSCGFPALHKRRCLLGLLQHWESYGIIDHAGYAAIATWRKAANANHSRPAS